MHTTNQINAPRLLPRVNHTGVAKIIAVSGGKGGIGKSAIAVNLAIALDSMGGRVLLVDGDLGLANADLLLDARTDLTLYDVMANKATLDMAISQTRFGISLLAAGSGRGEMESLGGGRWSWIMEQLGEMGDRFDFIVADTAAGIGEATMRLASSADRILVVVTPEPTSLRDAYATMKVLSMDHGVERVGLVVNMASTSSDGRRLYERLLRVVSRYLPLKLELEGMLVRDECFSHSIMEKEPLLVCFPHSVARKQILRMASRIVDSFNREGRDMEAARLVS